MNITTTNNSHFIKRFWQYQKERFPVFSHGILILSFSFSAICLSNLLRESYMPTIKESLVAFVASFIFFLQLRIADEFKDYEEDLKYRPYRPVQRGLISLKELGCVGIIVGVIQALMALWLYPKLLIILSFVWIYLALMSKEFFVRNWLTDRPVVYMVTHMVIIPFIDFYVTACDWFPTAGSPPKLLIWFILLSFINGMVIEIGRKIRAPEDEELGVQTYSALWGIKRSLFIFFGCLALTMIFACILGSKIQFFIPIFIILFLTLGYGVFEAILFIKNSIKGAGKRIEIISGIWTIILYLCVGIIPLFTRIFF